MPDMSQRAATSFRSRRLSDKPAAAVYLIRNHTRDAILASFPNANVPAPPELPYDHMVEWRQQQEVGAIIEYEATHRTASPGWNHNEQSTRCPSTLRPVQASSASQKQCPPQFPASRPAARTPPGTPTTGTSSPLHTSKLPPPPSVPSPTSIRHIVFTTNGPSADTGPILRTFPSSPAPSVLTTASTPPPSIQNVAFISSRHTSRHGDCPLEIRNVLESPSYSASTTSTPTPPATPSTPTQSVRQVYFTGGNVQVSSGLGLGIHCVPETPSSSIHAGSQAASPGDTGKTNRFSQAFNKVRSSLRSLHKPEKGFTVERRQER